MGTGQRGAFVLLEGIDHSGKTTQAALLCEALRERGFAAEVLRFPDRATGTGRLIDAYLRQQSELDDHAIHLLYTANRWEKAAAMRAALLAGTTLVVDRYAHSGVAYSAAKAVLTAEWCKAAERGLPRPDAVLYLDLPVATALARGADKQQERYEREAFQQRVKYIYEHELRDSSWTTIDAARPQQTVLADLLEHTLATIRTVVSSPIATLW